MYRKFFFTSALLILAMVFICATSSPAQDQVEQPSPLPAAPGQAPESAPPQPTSDRQKVAVLNFDINSSEKLEYLTDSIPQMLFPVLSASNRIEVVGQMKMQEAMDKLSLSSAADISEKSAIEIGQAVEARYVVMGSLTTIQSEISLDVRILDVQTGENKKSIKLRSKGLDSIMELVDLSAKNIVAWFEGREGEVQTRVMHRATGELSVTLCTGSREVEENKFKVFLNNKYVGDSHQSKKDKKEVSKGRTEDEFSYSFSMPVDVGVYSVKIVWKTKARGMFGKSKEISKQWDNIEISEGRVQKLEHTI
jgi:TolB-like protein